MRGSSSDGSSRTGSASAAMRRRRRPARAGRRKSRTGRAEGEEGGPAMTRRALALVLASLLAAPAAGQEAEKKFQPERCFPLECLAYLHVTSGADLLATCRETPVGRIAEDPEVRAALGNLPAMVRQMIR